jgi:hypothetical protein
LRATLLLALVACKGSPAKLASPEEARKIAVELAAAIEKCDRAAIEQLVDPRVLAKRAGGDDAFAAVVTKEFGMGPCGESKKQHFRAVADPTKAALRFEEQTGKLVGRVGWFVLVVEQGPRVVDVKLPLLPETLVERLTWNYDEPRGDHPGRVGDTFGFALEGVPTAGLTLLEHFEANVDAKPPEKDTQLGARIEYGSLSWNALAVEKAVAKTEALVGKDPYLDDLIAAVHRPEPGQMLEKARAVTAQYPDLADGWITLFYAQVLVNDFDAAMQSLDTLVTKFGFDYRPLGKQLPLARFTAHPAFVQKYPL